MRKQRKTRQQQEDNRNGVLGFLFAAFIVAILVLPAFIGN